MSRPVKNLIVDDYKKRFAGVENALVIDVRGVDAKTNNGLRAGLRKKNITVTVVKNTLAKKAFSGTPLAALEQALSGPAAIAFGGESVVDVARELIDWAKKIQNLTLRGACLDGQYFDGDAGVKALSKFPTRDEAIARVVTLVLSPAGKVVGAAKGPGGRVMGIVKTIQEKLEKGEPIAATG
ncbi:MAG: 50S ribosomal protein L10 [Phycisphaeraceae bacterium]|nr:50S ribosomal protein L10 [Phycisphaerales bacterium]QOJ18568.1 MAG: 50S ribosomal protein L10 [Phycisphaeraceae bacterium]